MPLPITSLLHLDIHLRDHTRELPEHEKQRLIALTAINHVGSLGRAVSFLSTAKILAANFDERVTSDLLEELDAAQFTIGEIQSCFADSAYAAVEEMFTAFTKLTAEDDAAADVVQPVKPKGKEKPKPIRAKR